MRRRLRLAAKLASAAAATALIIPAAAGAQSSHFPPCEPNCTIVVDSRADLPDADPGDGDCATAGGACTLRAAVQEANALRDEPPFQSKILVPRGTYELSRHGLDDTADRGDLDIHFVGEIIGAGRSRTTVDGDHADRVFDVHTTDARIAHLAITGGRATDGPGGGVRAGVLTYLEYLYLTANEAVPTDAPDSGKGGGISSLDSSITHTLVQHNVAQDGGGIWLNGAQYGLSSNTILKNHATRDGGGLLVDADDAFIRNVTISGNTALSHGGGVALRRPGNGSFFESVGATIASNTAPAGNGGGIWRGQDEGSESRFTGTIVARNRGGDCGGPTPLFSMGWNLDGDGSCNLDAATDIDEVDPELGSVAYNGGPTPTRALLSGSPALNAWDCNPPGFRDPATDQRGAVRPQGPACDIGAYEFGECCPAFEPPYQPGPVERPDPPRPPEAFCGPIVQGTAGPDVIVGNERRNELHGRAGDDRLFGKANGDCLYGGRHDDFLLAGAGGDELYGGAGADRMSGGLDEDLLLGGSGGDRLFGGPDEDRLIAQGGNDYIKGGDGYDTIRAGAGNDVIDTRGGGLDKVDCGKGHDRVRAEREEHLFRCEDIVYVD